MEDCCDSNEQKKEHDEKHNGEYDDEENNVVEDKGGKMDKSMKNLILWIVIAILAIAVLYVVFFKGGSSAGAVSAGKSVAQTASSYSGMVGGC